MTSSAERIANTVARFRKGLVSTSNPQMDRMLQDAFKEQRIKTGAIVDVTALYNDWMTGTHPAWDVFADSIMFPPYEEAAFCMVDGLDQTVIIGSSTYTQGEEPKVGLAYQMYGFDENKWERDPEQLAERGPIPWDEVKWILATSVWYDKPTWPKLRGPLVAWRFAVREDGSLEDVRYVVGLPNTEASEFDNGFTVYMKAITWLACRNIELVVPQRTRPERKRLARFGVEVNEIHVRPMGKTYQYERGTKVGDGVPLHTVRGHLARYGIDGRKKLFGKISGTFWIPAHARGSSEHGERNPTVILDTEGTTNDDRPLPAQTA